MSDVRTRIIQNTRNTSAIALIIIPAIAIPLPGFLSLRLMIPVISPAMAVAIPTYVLDGTINRNCSVRITREGNLIFEGKLASLKRFKDDVKEVKSGFECGMVFENFQDVAEEDQIEAYEMVEVPRK